MYTILYIDKHPIPLDLQSNQTNVLYAVYVDVLF